MVLVGEVQVKPAKVRSGLFVGVVGGLFAGLLGFLIALVVVRR